MIRPLTLICMALFLFAGFYDYQTTHRVDQIDQQIASTREAAAAARNDTKVLQTEWSWLNRPDRLQPFAAEFLSLQQVTPAQYVPLDQLAEHLPAPGSAPPVAQPAALPTTTLASDAPAAASPAQPAAVKLAESSPVTVTPKTTATPSLQPDTTATKAPASTIPDARLAEAAAPPMASPASTPDDASLASLERNLRLEAAAPATASALGDSQPAAPKAVKFAAAPVHATPRVALAGRPAAAAPRAAPSYPAQSGPVLVADSDPRQTSPPRSFSALGMAQTTPALPAPVAVSDAAWRNDQ